MARALGTSLLVLLVAMGCAFVSACGTSDGSIKSLTAVLKKHTALVKEGKFDKEAFKKEAEPHVKAMAGQKDGGIVVAGVGRRGFPRGLRPEGR